MNSKSILGTLRGRMRRVGAKVRKQTPVELKVHFAQDQETGLWYIAESDIPGLRVEAESADELIRKVSDVAPDLIELNVEEILASHSARRRRNAPKPPLNIRPVFDSPMPVACPA